MAPPAPIVFINLEGILRRRIQIGYSDRAPDPASHYILPRPDLGAAANALLAV